MNRKAKQKFAEMVEREKAPEREDWLMDEIVREEAFFNRVCEICKGEVVGDDPPLFEVYDVNAPDKVRYPVTCDRCTFLMAERLKAAGIVMTQPTSNDV